MYNMYGTSVVCPISITKGILTSYNSATAMATYIIPSLNIHISCESQYNGDIVLVVIDTKILTCMVSCEYM